MKVSAQIAARELFASIHAPLGLVNTMVDKMAKSERIRVLVDPSYKHRLGSVPRLFMGYRVVIETRQEAVSQRA